MRKVVISLIISLLTFACSENSSSETSHCSDFANKLNNRPHEADLRSSIDEGYMKFLAVRGYTLMFPGLEIFPYSKQQLILEKFGYEIIEGTSDMIEDRECGKFQKDAINYALENNQLIISSVAFESYLAEVSNTINRK